jgi:hypothetical protein
MVVAPEVEAAMTPSQAANALGLRRERVRQLGDAGRLPNQKTALGRLIDRGAVERLARERDAKQAEP